MGRLKVPGPGSYDIPDHMKFGGPVGGRGSATFASTTSRLRKETDHMGDPGAYDIEHVGVHMGKKEPMSAKTGRSFNRDINTGKGSFGSTSNRSSSAPPRSQRGGPGENDYSHMYATGASQNSARGSSSFMSSVPLGGHIRKSDTPGVGEYDPNKIESKNFQKNGSAIFAGSVSSRGVASKSTTGTNVGPGSYDLSGRSIEAQLSSKTNPRSPGFGSSTTRENAGGRSKSPAPGAYDAAVNQTLEAKSKRSFNTSASMGKANFGTFVPRLKEGKMGEGGDPGAYSIENQGVNSGKAESISARSTRSFNRDVGRGRGSFCSTSARSRTPDARSQRGGPGEHDYSHLYATGKGSQSARGSSSFLSATPLGGHVRKSDTPGVGEYNFTSPLLSKSASAKSGSHMFAGGATSRGASSHSTTGTHVGPGSYELDGNSIASKAVKAKNPRLPGFNSSSVRNSPED